MEQMKYAVKIGSTILPERFNDQFSAEQKRIKILEETHPTLPTQVVPVNEGGQELLFG